MCSEFVDIVCQKHLSFWEEFGEILSFLIIKRIQRDLIVSYIRRHVKYLLYLSNFIETWKFLTNFRKILKYQISRKSVKWERIKERTWRSFPQLCEPERIFNLCPVPGNFCPYRNGNLIFRVLSTLYKRSSQTLWKNYITFKRSFLLGYVLIKYLDMHLVILWGIAFLPSPSSR